MSSCDQVVVEQKLTRLDISPRPDCQANKVTLAERPPLLDLARLGAWHKIDNLGKKIEVIIRQCAGAQAIM